MRAHLGVLGMDDGPRRQAFGHRGRGRVADHQHAHRPRRRRRKLQHRREGGGRGGLGRRRRGLVRFGRTGRGGGHSLRRRVTDRRRRDVPVAGAVVGRRRSPARSGANDVDRLDAGLLHHLLVERRGRDRPGRDGDHEQGDAEPEHARSTQCGCPRQRLCRIGCSRTTNDSVAIANVHATANGEAEHAGEVPSVHPQQHEHRPVEEVDAVADAAESDTTGPTARTRRTRPGACRPRISAPLSEREAAAARPRRRARARWGARRPRDQHGRARAAPAGRRGDRSDPWRDHPRRERGADQDLRQAGGCGPVRGVGSEDPCDHRRGGGQHDREGEDRPHGRRRPAPTGGATASDREEAEERAATEVELLLDGQRPVVLERRDPGRRWRRRTGRRSSCRRRVATQLNTCARAARHRAAGLDLRELAEAPSDRDQRDAQQAGRQQPLGATRVERPKQIVPDRVVLVEQQPGDEEARQREEDRHAEVAAAIHAKPAWNSSTSSTARARTPSSAGW